MKAKSGVSGVLLAGAILLLVFSIAWTVLCGLQWTTADGHPWMFQFLGWKETSLYVGFWLDGLSGASVIGLAVYRGFRR